MTAPDYWRQARPELVQMVEELSADDALLVIKTLAQMELDHLHLGPALIGLCRGQIERRRDVQRRASQTRKNASG